MRNYRLTYKTIRTSMKYFTYKVYQVDPLTRENLNANGTYGGDDREFGWRRFNPATRNCVNAARWRIGKKIAEFRIWNSALLTCEAAACPFSSVTAALTDI